MSNDAIAPDIHTLLQTIHHFCTYHPSSTQFNFKLVVKDNNNRGGHQSVGNMKFSINQQVPSKHKQHSRPKSYGHIPNPDLVGFNHEIQLLLNHLIQSHHQTHVVGIVGPGGSGKTTLAKHIYHHPQINTHFAHKVWVCVSQSWDKATILKLMWRQVAQNPDAITMEFDEVVYELSKLLSSKSYLVVVDDIWSIDAWYDISPTLSPCSGSKVVVTTRNKFLPRHIDPRVLIVEPKQLNDEECYELFKKIALLDENIHHELKSLAVEMLKKCKGLPLAVVALAGVLGIDKRLSRWERISKRVTDQMLNMANDSTQGMVKEILALSYYELPQNLKPFALYLHVFPEDCVIEAESLFEMWIAECFMDERGEAEEYLDQLAQRCIVEVMNINAMGQVCFFRIHDLIREMLINIEKERGMVKNQQLRVAPSKTLHGDGQKDFDSRMKIGHRYLYGNSHARSLLIFNFQDLRNLKLKQLFIELKTLRVLILVDVPGSWLSEEIGNLIHLRYLRVSGRIHHLPRSIGNLENLLTLHLLNLEIVMVQTINLEKLKELRHLYMPWTNNFWTGRGVMGLENLKKLETLWNVKTDKWMLSAMPNLSDVLQRLYIVDIMKEEDLDVVFRTPIITSNNLHYLALSWECKLHDMSILSKCKNLTILNLRGEIKEGTPLMFPPNLIFLRMRDTYLREKQVMNIISNLCPFLKFLSLEDDAYTGTELVCNKNSFPRLEKLVFLRLCDEVKRWIIERGAMPRLDLLMISCCDFSEVNEEGWERISTIPNLICYETTTLFESKLQQWRKDWFLCTKEGKYWYCDAEIC